MYDRKQTTKGDAKRRENADNKKFWLQKKQFSAGMMHIDESWYWIPFASYIVNREEEMNKYQVDMW